ncbi:SURF4 family-domain-containing protein [Melampsora americana]|nr:SURF4 family-domain-containing protein [Melampsora americana]
MIPAVSTPPSNTSVLPPSTTTNVNYVYPPLPPVDNSLNAQRRPLTGYVPPTATVKTETESQFKSISNQIETVIESISKPLKPHLPRFGRFLLVSTFLEDALRIISQWNDQLEYLLDEQRYSKTFGLSFLSFNIIVMIVCSILVIIKRWSWVSFPGLISIMIGGLLLGLSDTLEVPNQVRSFAGLPLESNDQDSQSSKRTYLQLMGRILLIGFFVGQMILTWLRLSSEVTVLTIGIAALAIIACLLVVVGFKARGSALFLVLVSATINVMSNNWWSKPKDHPERDFRKYDFFQVLSIVGGLILLINQGPGGISVDEKRKVL